MWKDITGKTGYKNMQGGEYLYGNMKLLNPEELAVALADGLAAWIKPKPKPQSAETVLSKAKEVKINLVKTLFDIEVGKPVEVGGVRYNGGYKTVDRIEGARRLVGLKKGVQVKVYDVEDKLVILNPAQSTDLVITLGEEYENLYATRQALLVSIREALDLLAVEDVILPWAFVGEVI